MSEVKWTTEQQAVIDARNCDLLVSAAAGSGKTAVLSSRILSLLTDPERPRSIDRMLIVTFTNAAAAEMRERIGDGIRKAVALDPSNRHLRQQETLLHYAKITTIDSFCLYVVKNYFHTIGLPPGFSVMDPGERTLLTGDVVDQVMQEAYEAKDPAVLDFFTAYGTARSDENVRGMILKLAGFAESFPWPLQFLEEAGQCYASPETICESPLYRAYGQQCAAMLHGLAEELNTALIYASDADGPSAYVSLLENEAAQLAAVGDMDPELLSAAVQRVSFGRLPSVRNFSGDPEKRDRVKEIRDKVKKEFNNIKGASFFKDRDTLIRELTETRGMADALVSLTKRFLALFGEKKWERNLLDFSDIEHFALNILLDQKTHAPTPVAELLRGQFDELMVDEYQDSNYVQEAILKSIARTEPGKRNLFMVGDVKQSIYRFRQARPELFMEKYRQFKPEGEERRIDLHKNFRSREGVLTAVNRVFSAIMGSEIGHIAYTDAEALYPGRTFPENPSEACFGIRLMEHSRENLKAMGVQQKEALEGCLVADTVQRVLESCLVTDQDGTLRPCRGGDIAVLLRSPGKTGEEILRALKDAGIQAVLPLQTGYFDAWEVAVVLNFLRILDNPCQDIPLVSVMKSPIGGFQEEELALIRLEAEDPEAPFYVCARESSRTAAFYAMVERFRDLAVYLPVHTLVSRILSETGFLSVVSAMPGGAQRRDNLLMLKAKAQSFEHTSYHGLYRFIRYIESLRKYEVDYGEASWGNEDADTVRILSIHKSKGLEYPVVILAGAGRTFNRSDQRAPMVLSSAYGIGLTAVDTKKRTKKSTLPRDAIQCLTEAEEMGEEQRVLYVAMTRAKEKLIVTGTVEERQTPLPLSYRTRLSANHFLDWLLPVMEDFKEDYLVETVEPETILGFKRTLQAKKLLTLSELIEEAGRAPLSKALTERLSFVYPYEKEAFFRDKVSVSDLKKAYQEETEQLVPKKEKEIPVPTFLGVEKEEAAGGALRGSAVHRFLECFDFRKVSDLRACAGSAQYAFLEEEIRRVEADGLMEPDLTALLPKKALLSFFLSPLALRMEAAAKADTLKKEKAFVCGLSAGEVYHTDSEEIVLIQGIIDVYFKEGDRYVILDYKTDRVHDEEELKRKYNIQLEFYKEALKRITGEEKITTELYSFSLNREIILKGEAS